MFDNYLLPFLFIFTSDATLENIPSLRGTCHLINFSMTHRRHLENIQIDFNQGPTLIKTAGGL